MALRNRWIVREVNPYTYQGEYKYCVECRATNEVTFYGTYDQCVGIARFMNK